MTKNSTTRLWWERMVGLSFAVCLMSVMLLAGGCSAEKKQSPAKETPQTQAEVFYTCPMHPSVRLTDPKARCPICGMELVPVKQK